MGPVVSFLASFLVWGAIYGTLAVLLVRGRRR